MKKGKLSVTENAAVVLDSGDYRRAVSAAANAAQILTAALEFTKSDERGRLKVATMSKSSQIVVERLVVDVECPHGCLACFEAHRERQDRRERILAAQAELVDDVSLRAVATLTLLEPARLAA